MYSPSLKHGSRSGTFEAAFPPVLVLILVRSPPPAVVFFVVPLLSASPWRPHRDCARTTVLEGPGLPHLFVAGAVGGNT